MKLIPQISYKIAEILGEEKVNAVYEVVKSKPVSFSNVRYMLRRRRIISDIKSGKQIKEVMAENKVSRMTIYRMMKEN